MAQVILFGGGDAGGLIITANGVRRIPPFDPGVRQQLKGLSALVNARQSLRGRKDEREFGTLVNKLANLTIGRVEDVVGSLEGDQSLIYQDGDDGFICGSTGKPPIPLPRPRPAADLGSLIAQGVVGNELFEFVSAAAGQKIALRDVLADPAATAKRLSRPLSAGLQQDLGRLSLDQAKKAADPVEREVIEFFHKVVDDGRHIARFATEPAQVARDLGVKLSDHALDRVIAGGSIITDPGGAAMNPIGVAVMVGIVIMLVTRENIETVTNVRDLSGLRKL